MACPRPVRDRPGRPGSGILLCLVPLFAVLAGLGPGVGRAAPGKDLVLAVLGGAGDGRRLEAAVDGARVAAARISGEDRTVSVAVFDDSGSRRGLKSALLELKRRRPVGIVAVPSADLVEAYWKATRSVTAPWFFLEGVGPDGLANRGNVWFLGPSPAVQAVFAADTMLAPLAARRVAVIHEPTPLGRALASGFARNLSRFITLAGVVEWPEGAGAAEARGIGILEADWIYAAVSGGWAVSFVEALAAAGTPHRCLFADGNRCASLLARAPEVLDGSIFLDGPDAELEGRLGEDAVAALEEAGRPVDTTAIRSFEAARRLLDAALSADGTRRAGMRAILEEDASAVGAFGRLVYEPHRGIRLFPFTLWRARKGRLDLWDDDLLPTPGCGPPLGFGRPSPAPVHEKRGRMGFLTYGEGETRTIEQDLSLLGLSTNGAEPDLDETIRDEVLSRAMRIAHEIFRREPDGTVIPGWSWGITFTAKEPPEDMPRNRVWLAIVAGDHPAAGGQVLGFAKVAVYSTFLQRTMYVQRKLEPPLSAADRVLLDGTYRWGDDRTLNFRANKIRCLIDGFASAVGLTLSHEFGHLCGCGHDTEHPTSIMNVVAGAGAAWEDAVWIPSHEVIVTTSLGLEGR